MLNILKLLLLIPLFLFLCVMIAGQYWWVAMIVALWGSWFWFKADQATKRQRAVYQQQVEITRQKMVQAQQEAERAQRKADIADAVRKGVEDGQRKEWFEGQWN